MSLEALLGNMIENQVKILTDIGLIQSELKAVRKTTNLNKDAIDNMSDFVQILNDSLTELKDAVEEQVVITSEDIGENIGEQIEAAIDPILDLQNEKFENTCRKMASFMLRFAKSVEEKDKDKKPPPAPFKKQKETVVV